MTAKKQKLLYVCAYAYAREGRIIGIFTFHFTRFFSTLSITRNKQPVVFNKTTRHFQQNNTSFSAKQHVVFSKTTRRFQQNNTSFSAKQRVVFREKCRNRQRGAEKESTQAQTIFFHSVREILQIGFKAQKHTLHLGRILTGKIMFQIGIGGFVVEA